MEKQSFPAVLESLAGLRRIVKNAAETAGVDGEKCYQLQLAVDEIATNIISYGYGDAGQDSKLSISCELRDEFFVVTLEDQSPPFDPRTLLQKETDSLNLSPEERGIGGLGIYLAINGVDHFDYRREGGRNLNILEVRVSK